MTEEVLDINISAYFEQLNEAEKKSVLEIIKIFLKNRSQVFDRVSLEQYNREIDEAMERVARGEFTTQEDLEKEILTW